MFSRYNLLFLERSLESPPGTSWHSREQEQLVMPSSGLLLWLRNSVSLCWDGESNPFTVRLMPMMTRHHIAGLGGPLQSILDLEQGWGAGRGHSGNRLHKALLSPLLPILSLSR